LNLLGKAGVEHASAAHAVVSDGTEHPCLYCSHVLHGSVLQRELRWINDVIVEDIDER
jgi:hypothetical protein